MYGTKTISKTISIVDGVMNASGSSQQLSSYHYINTSFFNVDVSQTGASSYSWSKLNGNCSWTGAAHMLHVYGLNPNNQATFKVTTPESCEKTFTVVNVGSYYMVSPNPTSDFISIQSLSKSIEVFDEEGKSNLVQIDHTFDRISFYNKNGNIIKTKTYEMGLNYTEIDVSNFVAGTYTIEIWDGDKKESKTIIKI